MMKVYKKLTVEQKNRGVCFSSTLSNFATEQEGDRTHEITHEEYKDNPSEAEAKEKRLRDSNFFNGIYEFNIIRN